MSKQFYLYIYLNPLKPGNYIYRNYSFDREPFYVGKGKDKRCYDHLKETKEATHNPHKHYTIQKIKRNDLEPIVIKLQENLLEEKAFDLEINLITLIGRRDLGLGPLTNQSDGGEGSSGRKHSPSTRKKISKSLSGKKHTEERIRKRSVALSGREGCMKGKSHTTKSKRKMSESHIGKTHSETTKEKMKKSHSNITKATKRKMSDNSGMAKPIVFRGISYKSIITACRELNLSQHFIKKEMTVIS